MKQLIAEDPRYVSMPRLERDVYFRSYRAQLEVGAPPRAPCGPQGSTRVTCERVRAVAASSCGVLLRLQELQWMLLNHGNPVFYGTASHCQALPIDLYTRPPCRCSRARAPCKSGQLDTQVYHLKCAQLRNLTRVPRVVVLWKRWQCCTIYWLHGGSGRPGELEWGGMLGAGG